MSGYVKAGTTFLKNLLKGGKQKTTGTEVISSVPVSKDVKNMELLTVLQKLDLTKVQKEVHKLIKIIRL